MKRLSSRMFAVTTAACVIASMPFAAGKADDEGSAIYGVKIPPGYREWELVGLASVPGAGQLRNRVMPVGRNVDDERHDDG